MTENTESMVSPEQSSKKSQNQTIVRTAVKNMVANSALAVFKVSVGLFSGSTAMVSEGIHTATDAFSTVLVAASLLISGRSQNHDKKSNSWVLKHLESLVAILLSVVLFVTGVGIASSAYQKIKAGRDGVLEAPGALALVAALLSIGVKEWMFRYTKKAAQQLQSPALLADAWHHRTDALTYIGSLLGILGARLGFPILDPIAGGIIALFILKSSVEILIGAVRKITGKSDTLVLHSHGHDHTHVHPLPRESAQKADLSSLENTPHDHPHDHD